MICLSRPVKNTFALSSTWRVLRAVVLLVLFVSTTSPPAFGQGAGLGQSLGVEPTAVAYPPREYYLALELYRTGELDRAIDAFEFSTRRTRRDINGHWIDAIPCYAMLGESRYWSGDLEGAMQSFDMVINIAIRHRGWLSRPLWDELFQPGTRPAVKQYLWAEANSVNRLPLAGRVKLVSGQVITERDLATASGQAFEELNIKNIDIVEVMRGIALTSYRRRTILGPLAEGDALASQLLESTKYPAGLASTLGRNLIGAMRATERYGAMQDERAVTDAQKYATFNGGVHPLSPHAGLCSASAIAGSNKPATAVPICLAVSNQFASMDAFEWVGESLQLAAGCATKNEANLVQQAGVVAANNLLRKSRLCALHCLLASADAAVTAGDVASAIARLEEAQAILMRRDVLQPRLAAYGAYIKTRIAAKTATPIADVAQPWADSFGAMMNFATKSRNRKQNLISMPTLFQLQRVRLALGRTIEGESADQLLAQYCSDPTVDVWRRDPVDAIAGVMADRELLRLARLRTAAGRESGQDVMARIEDLQSGRIRQGLPFNGRVLQVRALARLPDDLLTKDMANLRNVAPESIRQLRTQVSAVQAAPPGDPNANDGKIQRMETDAWSAAFERIDIPNVMPHPINEKQPAADIPSGVGVLSFCQDGGILHAALCTRQKSTYWSVKGAARVGTQVGQFVRGIGGAASRGGRLPKEDQWRALAVELRDKLIMPGTGTLLEGRLAGIDKLIIVPDSLLWYLPFETLPIEDADSKLLGDAIEISYAPTPSLAMYPTAPASSEPVVALAAGSLFAPRDAEVDASIVQTIVDTIPPGQCLRLPQADRLPTSRLGGRAGHLIVASPVTPVNGRLLESRLANYEVTQRAGALGAWLEFPADVPSTVFLAGFRSNLDTKPAVSGEEIAHTIAILQYAGVRDVLTSRWAVGGESSAILLREFAQELPFLGAEAAFDRARNVLRRSELVPGNEPTLSGDDLERDTLTGAEPFFWSSYLHASPASSK
ncbi:MAG: CHAT domain-containing protein [Planctomycetota bacterium]